MPDSQDFLALPPPWIRWMNPRIRTSTVTIISFNIILNYPQQSLVLAWSWSKWARSILNPRTAKHIQCVRHGGIKLTLRHTLDQQTALTLYKSLITPYFDFGSIIYEVAPEYQLRRPQVIQNSAAKLILDLLVNQHAQCINCTKNSSWTLWQQGDANAWSESCMA